jgi:ATP-dependent exoDNAse (exonuclease V) alpha subunit
MGRTRPGRQVVPGRCKVMQIKNKYGKKVFNADFGRIITRDLAIAVNNAKTRQ